MPGSVRASDLIFSFVHIKLRDGLAKAGPDADVIHACRHHEHQHIMGVDLWGVDNLKLEGLLGASMALAPDHPGMHLLGHVAEGWQLIDVIEVFGGHGGFGHVLWSAFWFVCSAICCTREMVRRQLPIAHYGSLIPLFAGFL
jgi:hypothetical protein